jgi:alpha 1,3-glucosidase
LDLGFRADYQQERQVEGRKEGRARHFGDKGDFEAIVEYEPLKVKLLRGGKEQVVVNGQGLLHMEHFRTKRTEEAKTDEAPVAEGDAQAVVQTPLANPRA